MPTANEIMLRMGFPDTETGPYVTELRKLIEKQVSEGLRNRSAGTWVGNHSHEERARIFLMAEWNIQQGYAYKVKVIDPPIRRVIDLKTMKRRWVIKWHRLPAWLGDKLRAKRSRLRMWRDRVLGIQNPYKI